MTDPHDPHHDHDHDHDHNESHHHDHDHAHDHAHSHDHAHDHGHDPFHAQPDAPLNTDELDPANRSLAEALRVSFGVLKIVMVLIVIAFLLSGGFEVKEGQVGVRLHFGAVVGDRTPYIYEPGWHFAWPEPIDRTIIVPTGVQEVHLDSNDDFWFYVRPDQRTTDIDQLPKNQQLQPGHDGSLITGDKNIVHAKFTINYHISKQDAAEYAQNVGSLKQAQELVHYAAARGAVKAVATSHADEFVRSNYNSAMLKDAIRKTLDTLHTGITVDQVLLEQPTAPLSVRDAFRAVSEAESQRADKIEVARKKATQALNAVAGEGHEALLDAIDAYETARRNKDAEAIKKTEQHMWQVMESPTVSGQVASILSDANTYRTETKKTIEAEKYKFAQLLPQFQDNPRIVTDRLQQDARQDILSGDVETFYLPSDPDKTVYLELNRDPRIRKRKEAEAYKQQQNQNSSTEQPGE